jgi:hypothetical protein
MGLILFYRLSHQLVVVAAGLLKIQPSLYITVILVAPVVAGLVPVTSLVAPVVLAIRHP